MRERTQQEREIQRVVERMRPEFDTTKPQSLETEGHERYVPASSKSATDSISGESSEELKLRLERLESLILQLAEKLVVAECRTPAESGNQLEQVNLRLDRIEALLSHPLEEDNSPKRPTASPSHDKPTPTDGAAVPWNGIPLSGVILASLIGCGLGAAKVYDEHKKEIQAVKEAAQEEADKRRCNGEALAERQAVEFGIGSRAVDSDKKWN
ncbi:hypothetical protein AAVH_21212 [Aphelenchoides avenae]|nr:hypothetical protein AAVH_21212 [Aphelenchus avenae]